MKIQNLRFVKIADKEDMDLMPGHLVSQPGNINRRHALGKVHFPPYETSQCRPFVSDKKHTHTVSLFLFVNLNRLGEIQKESHKSFPKTCHRNNAIHRMIQAMFRRPERP
ncbi:hypothetical protein ACFL60_01955 [Candidatus Omnitrophota bacterium]